MNKKTENLHLQFGTEMTHGLHVINMSGVWGEESNGGFNLVIDQCSGRYASVRNVTLNMSDLKHIGDAGIQCLHDALKASRDSGVEFYIKSATGQVAEIINASEDLRSICIGDS